MLTVDAANQHSDPEDLAQYLTLSVGVAHLLLSVTIEAGFLLLCNCAICEDCRELLLHLCERFCVGVDELLLFIADLSLQVGDLKVGLELLERLAEALFSCLQECGSQSGLLEIFHVLLLTKPH